nr:MAG TPA: hypothetical protein [Caudoviricetes sp.]
MIYEQVLQNHWHHHLIQSLHPKNRDSSKQ